MKEKKKLIKRWVALLIVSALNFVENKFISKIPSEWVRGQMSLMVVPMKETAMAISDSDANNKEQVEEIWKRAINGSFIEYNQVQVLDKIEQNVTKEHLKRPLQAVVPPLFGMIKDVTDDNPKDGEQIGARWLEFVKNEDVQEIVLSDLLQPALVNYIKDIDTVEFILNLIRASIESGEANIEEGKVMRVLSSLPEPQLT